MLASLVVLTIAQGEIPAAKLPGRAGCTFCAARGVKPQTSRPGAGQTYKGKSYYFCNSNEAKAFRQMPEYYLPLVLPQKLKFDLTDARGNRWNESAFKGKVVLLDYWATWCGPCHRLKPSLDILRQAYGPKGLVVLSVSIDESKAELDRFLAAQPFSNPVLWDSKMTRLGLKVHSIPALFVVKNGTVMSAHRGQFKLADLEDSIRKQLLGK